MKKIFFTTLLAALLFFPFLGCRKEHTDIEFLIGVAQANLSEPWREVMNAEIQNTAHSYSGVRVVFTNAADNWERQTADIDKLIRLGIDLLIVSPVESREITPAIRTAHKEVPVIVIDKAIEGYDYTLFIGVDNDLVGRQAGRYVCEYIGKEPGRVVEVTGSSESLPVIERKAGFRKALDGFPNIELAGSFDAAWHRDQAEDLARQERDVFTRASIIFAHNDAMALGIYRALAGEKHIPIIGIDGLTGPEGGLALVESGILDATIICPTGGKEAVHRAMDILQKRDGLPKKIFLRSSLVTRQILQENHDQSLRQSVRSSGKPPTLGFAQTGRESAWREANTKSIISAAKQSGVELLFENAELNQQKQIDAIRSFIDAGVDVIAFSPLVSTGWDEVLEEARRAGIPVICSDRTVKVADETLVTTYLVADFIEEGRRAAQWLLEETAEKEKICIVEIAGLPGSTPAIDRQKGFADVINRSARHSIIDSESGDFIGNLGYEVMKQFLKRHSKIDAVYAHNDDMALGAVRAIEEAGLKPGSDILLVSIDGVKAAFQAMKKGKLNCSVECSPLLGPQLMKAVLDYVHGEELPLRINTEEGVFPRELAKEYLPSRQY